VRSGTSGIVSQKLRLLSVRKPGFCTGDNLNPDPPHLLVGFQAVQVFDPPTQRIETVAWLQRARWYATIATLADGNLLVVGGMQQVAQPVGRRVLSKFNSRSIFAPALMIRATLPPCNLLELPYV
jgi:hypothetical protein